MIRKYTLLLLTFTFALLAQSLSAYALDIKNVRFGDYNDKVRLVLDLSEAAQYRTFVLSDPYRMVIDLPSFTWRAGQVQEPQSAGITATRHGNLDTNTSRIVFDLNRPISIQNAFTLPASGEKPNRLVIDFANASESVFAKTQNKVFGDLDDEPSSPKQATKIVPSQNNGQKPLVIIDAGHGGVDPGASGHGGLYERNITLALAKELKSQLVSSGKYRVHMTRDKDVFIKLRERVNIARRHNGDLFISIHADALDNKSVQGASVYTLSEKASDAQTAKLAARENKADLIAGVDLETEDKDVADILMDLAMRDTMNQSKFFANTVVDTFRSKGLKTLGDPHRSAGFAVLKAPDIPSVLVEAGFMSNKQEASMLNTQAHRKKIATALKIGIDRYFDQVAKNQRM